MIKYMQKYIIIVIECLFLIYKGKMQVPQSMSCFK